MKSLARHSACFASQHSRGFFPELRVTDVALCFPVRREARPGLRPAIWPGVWESKSTATDLGTIARGEV